MDYQQFLDLARSPPVRALLRETISPHLKPGRRAIVYPLGLTNRIGHLAPEPHYFSTLFAGDYEQLILLTSPKTTKGVNQALYDLLAEQFTMVETDQEILLRLGLLNDGVVSEQGFDICLSLPVRFYREYVMRRAGGTELQFLKLTDDLRDRGAAWFNELGLKPDQPFVALHVRDPSHVPQVEYQEHGDMRSASLDNYVAAVDWLADQGFAVFRLGDREAKPLRHASPMVFDLPFMARHESWMDVFLCGACTFSVNCQSGPEALVRAFGNRSVNTNLTPYPFGYHLPHDLFLYKPIYLGSSEAAMSYAEMLRIELPVAFLPFMLPDPKFFAAHDLRSRENSPEVLFGAVHEMVQRIKVGKTLASSEANDTFISMSKAFQAHIAGKAEIQAKFFDQYPPAFGFGKLAEAQLTQIPNFLQG